MYQPFVNPYQKNRLNSIFGIKEDSPEEPNPGVIDDTVMPRREAITPPSPPQSDSSLDAGRYFDEIMKIRQNPGPNTSAYKQMLQESPNPEDYKPGKLGRIAAVVGGVGAGLKSPEAGVNLARDIITTPYRTAMNEYGNKVGLAAQGAKLEEGTADDTVKALSEARAMGLKYDEARLKMSEFKQKTAHEGAADKVAADRAAAYITKMGQPDYDYQPQADGSILAINKHNSDDRKTIPAKTVAAAQLDVSRENARSAARTAGAAERNAGSNERNATTNAENADSLKRYRDRSLDIRDKQGKLVSPTQQAEAIQISLAELKSDPHFKDFVEPDPNAQGFLRRRTDDGSPLYREFVKELQSRAEKSIRKGSPYTPGDEGVMDNEIIFDKPKGGGFF